MTRLAPTARSFPVHGAAIARKPAQPPLCDGADRKPHQNIAGPMRQQQDPGCDQAATEQPYRVALRPWQSRCGRCQRADVNGMPGGKGIQPPSGERHATPVAAHGAPIGALLIDHGLEQMRHRRRDECRQQHMVGRATSGTALAARKEPPCRDHGTQDMPIRSPRESFGDFLRRRIGVRRNPVRDGDIGCGRTNGYQSHFEHPDKQAITPATGTGSEIDIAFLVPPTSSLSC